MKDLLTSVSHNAHVKGPQGNRYGMSLKMFLCRTYLKGGRSLCRFVSENLKGPSIDYLDEIMKELRVPLKLGIEESNFIAARKIVVEWKKKYGIKERVPVLMAED